ncbi:MAG: hypothetical protein MR350_04215 [Alphaproteobacteria bacterium]|nr:hypothetical protein [Alphaproteobacteria bacterium]
MSGAISCVPIEQNVCGAKSCGNLNGPLPLIGKTKAITEILEHFKPLHLYGVGRWGEHQHHNHDVCMKNAMDFVNTLPAKQ